MRSRFVLACLAQIWLLCMNTKKHSDTLQAIGSLLTANPGPESIIEAIFVAMRFYLGTLKCDAQCLVTCLIIVSPCSHEASPQTVHCFQLHSSLFTWLSALYTQIWVMIIRSKDWRHTKSRKNVSNISLVTIINDALSFVYRNNNWNRWILAKFLFAEYLKVTWGFLPWGNMQFQHVLPTSVHDASLYTYPTINAMVVISTIMYWII